MSKEMSEREELKLKSFEKKLYSLADSKTPEPFYRDSRNSMEGVPEFTIPVRQFDPGKEEKIDIVRGQLATSSRFERLSPSTKASPKITFADPKNFFNEFNSYDYSTELKSSPEREKDLIELAWRAFLAPNSVWEQGQAEAAASHFLEILNEKIGSAAANEFFKSIKEKYAPTLGTRSRIQYPNLSARIKDQTLGRIERWLTPNKE